MWLGSSEAVSHSDAGQVRTEIEQARCEVELLKSGAPHHRREIMLRHVERVDVADEALTIQLRPKPDQQPAVLTAAIGRIRCGNDTRIVVKAESGSATHPDQQLVQMLADARAAQQLAMANADKSLSELASIAGIHPPRFKQLLRLSYLVPSIVQSIMSGSTPPAIARIGLRNLTGIDLSWDAQRRTLELA
jgi:site-specific DNA recombinase